MLHRLTLALPLLAFGCKGELINPDLPGGSEPPATNVALAFRFGGPGTERVTAMAADPSGGIYVAGTFTGAADFDPGSGVTVLNSLGGADGFLAKYSATGALVWVSRVGGSGEETLTALVRDGAGNLYVSGGFTGATDFDPGPGLQVLNSSGAQDGYVAKYTPAGDLLWARRFGGIGADEVAGVAVDGSGRVYAAGSFTGQADALPLAGAAIIGDGAAADGFLISFDPAGALRWAEPLGGPLDDAALAVALSNAGNVVVAGVFRGSANFSRNAAPTSLAAQGGADAFLASYAQDGALQWVRGVGGLGDESIARGGLTLDAGSGTALLGRFSGSVDFDPGPAVVGRTSVGEADLFLVRFDATGSFRSVLTIGGPGAVLNGERALADADGSVLLAGSFAGSLDFDPGAGTTSLSSLAQGGATDVFVARYSAAAGLFWVSRFGEATSAAERVNSATALALDPTGGVLVSGRVFGSPDFDPGNKSFRLVSVGEADGFVVRLTADGALATTP